MFSHAVRLFRQAGLRSRQKRRSVLIVQLIALGSVSFIICCLLLSLHGHLVAGLFGFHPSIFSISSLGAVAGSAWERALSTTGAGPARASAAGAENPRRGRGQFLAELGASPTDASTLLAAIQLRDFARIAAFDRRRAEGLMAELASRARSTLRKETPLARVEPDCLAAILRGRPEAEGARELRALAYVLKNELGVGADRITPDIGVAAAIFPRDGAEPEALLARTLAALPRQGEDPSDLISFTAPGRFDDARDSFQLEQDLRAAIGKDQFRLAFQPIVDLIVGRVTGAEALLRWRRPLHGEIAPARFVPPLEESGLIEEVGLWALDAACREARGWRDKGLSNLTVAVNLSAVQVRPSLPLTIVRTLARHRLTPEWLEVELTETAAMRDAARTREVLEQLKEAGLGVAIDDFGAGYSNLSYLKNLPFTKLKIDREFTHKVHERADCRAICAALVALAGGLGIRVMAEGVEERGEVETLLGLGCSTFQGYFFAPPLSAEDFAEVAVDQGWLAGLDLEPPSTEALERPRS
jgi:EAL domain-containing protein (putative c-di-GMP-specific phosphodiesterase class I)/GGDEF domain-containing protein